MLVMLSSSSRFQKVVVCINKHRLISPPIKVPTSAVTAVEIHRVGRVKALYELAEVGFTGHDNQMKMVVHEHIGMHLHEKSDPVCVPLEYASSLISPADQMVPGTRVFYSKRPSHAGIYQSKRGSVTFSYIVPDRKPRILRLRTLAGVKFPVVRCRQIHKNLK